MKKLLKAELKKAFCSTYFLLGTFMLTLFAVLSAWYMLSRNGGYTDAIKAMTDYPSNPDLPLFSFYNHWIGAERMSLSYVLFYNLLPIGAALPFAWSFYTESKSGYIKNITSRIKKSDYYKAKVIAVFLSGMSAVLIPLVVNILFVSAKMPLYEPFAGYNFYNGIYFGTMFADLFFTHPMLYVMVYVALTCLYGGIFALFGSALSFYIKNIFSAVLLPFVIMLAAGFAERTFFVSGNEIELVPTLFLHATTLYNKVFPLPVAIVTFVLIAFSLLTIYFKGVRCEIY